MAEQPRQHDDPTMPNRAANMEKAEGEPLSREEHEQAEVPPRGEAKEGGHA